MPFYRDFFAPDQKILGVLGVASAPENFGLVFKEGVMGALIESGWVWECLCPPPTPSSKDGLLFSEKTNMHSTYQFSLWCLLTNIPHTLREGSLFEI